MMIPRVSLRPAFPMALSRGLIKPVQASVTSEASLPPPVWKRPAALGLAVLGVMALGSVSAAAPEAFFAQSDGASMETSQTFDDPFLDLVYNYNTPQRRLEREIENNPFAALDWIIRSHKEKPYAQSLMETIAKREPVLILIRASEFQDQPYAAEVVRQAAAHDPGEVLRLASLFKDRPYAEAVLKQASDKDPVKALVFGFAFRDQPYALPIIHRAAERTVEINPRFVLEYGNVFKDHPGAKATMQRAVEKLLAEREYMNLLVDSGKFAKEPYAEHVISAAADALPRAALEAARGFADQPYGTAIIQKAIKKAFLLNDRRAIRAYARLLNHLHDSPEEIRFAGVKEAAAKDLYNVIVEGDDELFTSSFNGLFDRLLIAMAKENLKGDELLARVEQTTFRNFIKLCADYNLVINCDLHQGNFRSFIKLCADYNRLNEFLETMNPAAREQLLARFAKGIDKERDPVSQAVVAADVFGIVTDPDMIKIFKETIRAEYQRTRQEQSKQGTVLYGLLTGMFGEKGMGDEQWVEGVAQKFSISNLNVIPSEKLFTPDGLQVQRHFFYYDRDGYASFESFIAQYQADPAWTVESHEKFVRITGSRNGKRLEIYANRPAEEKAGQDEIERLLKERRMTPAMVVHRGHSYHAGKTLERLSAGAQIVYLGSCGGYNNVAAVLEKSPEAHIISTKSRGTMQVNDPLLKLINESMLAGGPLSWPTVWADAEARLGGNPDFRQYIPPPKNLGVLFLKAYQHALPSSRASSRADVATVWFR